MKLLLAATMTMLLAGSAFGACVAGGDTSSCSKAECDTMKYSWNEKAERKCISPDGPVGTNCAEGNGEKRDAKAAVITPTSDGSSSVQGAKR